MKKIFKHKIKSLLLVNKIVVIHYLELDEYFYHPEEQHDFWEIVCAYKNDIIITADGKNITLNEGEMYFHKPNQAHSLTVKGQESTGVFVISFECLSESMRFFTDRKVKLNKGQIKYVNEIIKIAKNTYDITFYNLDTDIMNLLANPTLGGEQLIKNNLEILLIDLMRSLTETEDGNDVFLQETEINNKIAEDIIKILKNNVYKRLTVEDISKMVSYSKAYVFRQFKLATGKGVMEYYTELKIKTAKQLIKENELSVKEISERLCFDTPNYFSKTFKKAVGETPTQYRTRVLS
jgi:AraC-like DNA-binding protein